MSDSVFVVAGHHDSDPLHVLPILLQIVNPPETLIQHLVVHLISRLLVWVDWVFVAKKLSAGSLLINE